MKKVLLATLMIAASAFLGCSKQEVEPTAPTDVPAPTAAVDTTPAVAEPAAESAESPVVEISGGQAFLNLLENNSVVLIDFFSYTCPPCMRLSPEIDKMATEFKDQGLTVGKVNTEQLSDVAAIFNVSAIPDIRIFVNGKELDAVLGYDPDGIRAMIKKALDVKAGKTGSESVDSASAPVADPNGPAEATPFPTLPTVLELPPLNTQDAEPAPVLTPATEAIPTPEPAPSVAPETAPETAPAP